MELLKLEIFSTFEIEKEPRSKDTDADAGSGADADTLARQQTCTPRSRGAPKQAFSARSSTPSIAGAAASSCASSQVPTSPSGTESVASPTAAVKRDLEGVEAQLRGLANRRARVEVELLRITCEETFSHRQQRRLRRVIYAAKHGGDADAVECSLEVEVASGPAPTGLHVSRSRYLVSGWIDKLDCFFVVGVTLCAPDFFPGDHDHQVCRRS